MSAVEDRLAKIEARAWNGWIDEHRHLTSRTGDLSMAFEDGWDAAIAAALGVTR